MITNKNDAFLDFIEGSNFFAMKIFLEHGLVDKDTLDKALETAIENFAPEEIIKLLMNSGGEFVRTIDTIIKLSNDLFFEYITGIDYQVTVEFLIKNLRYGFTIKKWKYITENFNFDSLNLSEGKSVHDLLFNASYNKEIFMELLGYLKERTKPLFLLFVNFNIYISSVYNNYLPELVDAIDFSIANIVFCYLAKFGCLDLIYKKINNGVEPEYIETVKSLSDSDEIIRTKKSIKFYKQKIGLDTKNDFDRLNELIKAINKLSFMEKFNK